MARRRKGRKQASTLDMAMAMEEEEEKEEEEVGSAGGSVANSGETSSRPQPPLTNLFLPEPALRSLKRVSRNKSRFILHVDTNSNPIPNPNPNPNPNPKNNSSSDFNPNPNPNSDPNPISNLNINLNPNPNPNPKPYPKTKPKTPNPKTKPKTIPNPNPKKRNSMVMDRNDASGSVVGTEPPFPKLDTVDSINNSNHGPCLANANPNPNPNPNHNPEKGGSMIVRRNAASGSLVDVEPLVDSIDNRNGGVGAANANPTHRPRMENRDMLEMAHRGNSLVTEAWRAERSDRASSMAERIVACSSNVRPHEARKLSFASFIFTYAAFQSWSCLQLLPENHACTERRSWQEFQEMMEQNMMPSHFSREDFTMFCEQFLKKLLDVKVNCDDEHQDAFWYHQLNGNNEGRTIREDYQKHLDKISSEKELEMLRLKESFTLRLTKAESQFKEKLRSLELQLYQLQTEKQVKEVAKVLEMKTKLRESHQERVRLMLEKIKEELLLRKEINQIKEQNEFLKKQTTKMMEEREKERIGFQEIKRKEHEYKDEIKKQKRRKKCILMKVKKNLERFDKEKEEEKRNIEVLRAELTEARQENERLKMNIFKNLECVVCVEQLNGNRALLLPCAHAQVCLDCAIKLYKMSKRCPICRNEMSSIPLPLPNHLYF